MTNATKGMTEYQHEIAQWCVTVFGEEIARNVPLRCYRFFEEATELVQSLGMTQEQCVTVMQYVYGRPVGEPHQEVGGTAVTFAALCAAQGLSMHNCAWAEHERCMRPEVMEKIRNKQKNKPNPLTVLPAPYVDTSEEHPAEQALRALASWLGVGGYNAPTVDANVFEAKIREGVLMYSLTHTPTVRDLAEVVLDMGLITPKGLRARDLARQVLGITPNAAIQRQEAKVPFHLSADREAAVSDEHRYLAMDVCPRGVKVLLLTLGGVATLGVYDGHDTQWRGWFPLPKECK